MTSSNVRFVWTKEISVAIETFKKYTVELPVLAFPYLEITFVIETDASAFALRAVLAQKKADDKFHPIQFANQTLNTLERN